MQIIFQDPYGSLDPRRRVGAQIADGLAIHGLASGARARAEVSQRLADVGLDPSHAERYPHEFSGGQRQRIGIARALATRVRPSWSPTSRSARSMFRFRPRSWNCSTACSMNASSHCCSSAMICRSCASSAIACSVMYLGRIVEAGPAATVLRAPGASLHARARLGDAARRRRQAIAGASFWPAIRRARPRRRPAAPSARLSSRGRRMRDVVPPMQKLELDRFACLHQTVRDRLRGNEDHDGRHDSPRCTWA